MRNDQIEVARSGCDGCQFEPVRRGVDELAALDQRRRLGKPRRIPERANLAPRLIARACAAIEPVE